MVRKTCRERTGTVEILIQLKSQAALNKKDCIPKILAAEICPAARVSSACAGRNKREHV